MRRLFYSVVLVSALLTLAALPGAAAGGEITLGVLPSGWSEGEPAHESIKQYLVYQEKGTVLAELLCLEEELPEEMTPEEYLEAVKQNSMPSFTEYAPLEDEPAMLHGREAIVHRFHFSNQRDTLKGEMYVFVLGETGYLFLFDTTDEWFDKLHPKFLSFVKNVLRFPEQEVAPVVEDEEEEEEEEDGLPLVEDEEDEDEDDNGLPLIEDEEDDEDDGLPSFEEDEGVISGENAVVFATLPEGAEETRREDGEVFFEGPDESEIFIALADGPEAISKVVEQRVAGMRKQGASTLKCGDHEVSVVLYSEKREGGASSAVLTARWEGTGAAVGIRLPQKNYKGAAGWIKEMLCSVEIEER